MATRKRSKAPPRRAKRSTLGAWTSLRPPSVTLEPHHVDVIALALIAVGIFLAGVGYLGWSGGTLGHGIIQAFRFLIGAIGYNDRNGSIAPTNTFTALASANTGGQSQGTGLRIQPAYRIANSSGTYAYSGTYNQTAQRWARARPFAPPRGSAGQVCSQLATPASFVPNAVLTGGQRISAAHPQLFGPFAPSWSEQIDVYPGAAAATMVKALTTLPGQPLRAPPKSGQCP